MARLFKRRRLSRRRTTRRRRFGFKRLKRAFKRLSAASFAYRVSSQYPGSATGFFSSPHSQLPTGAGNSLFHLTEIPAGAGEGARVGNRCSLRRLFIRGWTFQDVPSDPSIASEQAIGRILVWLVKDNDGEVLNNSGSNTDIAAIMQGYGVNNTILPFLRPEMRGKIRILKDKVLVMRNTTITNGAGTSEGRHMFWKMSFNLRKLVKGVTTFTGSTGVNTEAEKNHIYIAFIQVATVTLAGSLVSNWQHYLSFDP